MQDQDNLAPGGHTELPKLCYTDTVSCVKSSQAFLPSFLQRCWTKSGTESQNRASIKDSVDNWARL